MQKQEQQFNVAFDDEDDYDEEADEELLGDDHEDGMMDYGFEDPMDKDEEGIGKSGDVDDDFDNEFEDEFLDADDDDDDEADQEMMQYAQQ